MKNRLISSVYLACLLSFVVSINCSSTKKRTEERAKERVTQFIHLMAEDRIEEAEKLLSRQLEESETKELFLDSYDTWKLKGTSIVIEVGDVIFHVKDNKNIAMMGITIRNEKSGFTRHANMQVRFEKGDWYIGG